MDKSINTESVGVIVARFQVVILHDGHKFLGNYAKERHPHLMIVLGSTGGILDDRNFLPFDMRKEMALEAFPGATVVELLDHPISHEAWSEELDALVAKTFPGMKAVAYGSRNSFLETYKGNMEVVEVPEIANVSGTNQRNGIEIPNTPEVRMGMLKAAKLAFSTSYATTDLAIVDLNEKRVLLIGRHRELGKLRFPGGVADPDDDSYEITALREGSEEVPSVKVKIWGITYIGSKRINDRRYEGSRHGIKTAFFMAQYSEGNPTVGDDADYVQWVPLKDVLDVLVKPHLPLGEMLQWHLRHYMPRK